MITSEWICLLWGAVWLIFIFYLIKILLPFVIQLKNHNMEKVEKENLRKIEEQKRKFNMDAERKKETNLGLSKQEEQLKYVILKTYDETLKKDCFNELLKIYKSDKDV